MNRRMSDASHARLMREVLASVGVEHRKRRRFQNVFVRALPRLTGSPSAPALGGYRSTSSNNATRIGRDASEAGELAPAMVR